MQADLNTDYSTTVTRLGGPQQALVDSIRSSYPPDSVCLYTRTFNIANLARLQRKYLLQELPGFKEEVCDRNPFVEVTQVKIRFSPTKTGSSYAAALTYDASAGSGEHDIITCKSMIFRRVTDLSLGTEVHELPMHNGMSSVLTPTNVAGKPIYILLNAMTGILAVQVYYRRGGSAIANSGSTIKEDESASQVPQNITADITKGDLTTLTDRLEEVLEKINSTDSAINDLSDTVLTNNRNIFGRLADLERMPRHHASSSTDTTHLIS